MDVIIPQGKITLRGITHFVDYVNDSSHTSLQASQIGSAEMACLNSEVLSGMSLVVGSLRCDEEAADPHVRHNASATFYLGLKLLVFNLNTPELVIMASEDKVSFLNQIHDDL